jgi:hypothetical protein
VITEIKWDTCRIEAFEMTNWEEANGFQLEALVEAFLFTYPQASGFHRLFVYRLNDSFRARSATELSYRDNVANVVEVARGEGWLSRLVGFAKADKPNAPRLRTLEQTFGLINPLTANALPGGRGLEDYVRVDAGFKDLLPWVNKAERAAYRLCKIEYLAEGGLTVRGTGWLVAADLVLTNWHVIRRIETGQAKSSDVVCLFDHMLDLAGRPADPVEIKLAADWKVQASPASDFELGIGPGAPTADHLDYALLRLVSPIGDRKLPNGENRGWFTLSASAFTPNDGAILFVFQHPSGEALKIAPGVARGLCDGGFRLRHDANTDHGSSGSPCFDAALDPVALHHAGDPDYDGLIGKPQTNRAVPLSMITAHLKARQVQQFLV